MRFEPKIAAIRFGDGLSPLGDRPDSVAGMLSRLAGDDLSARSIALKPFSAHLPILSELQRLRTKAQGSSDAKESQTAFQDKMKPFAQDRLADQSIMLARAVAAQDGFRERLVRFWADHFTTLGRNMLFRGLVPAYIEEAIRPHVAGSFTDMLRAAVTHPMMLTYLDQPSSIGPNSKAGLRSQSAGLNENLARELLELHTLGVDGPYDQKDVREMAELLTGLGATVERGTVFRANRAEPGAEQVLGKSYGGGDPALGDIHAALADLAMHEATAVHLARKLAIHFTSDEPDEALVFALRDAWLESGGSLLAVYEQLLSHPASWQSFGQKVKQPVDFVISSLRAFGLQPRSILTLRQGEQRRYLLTPMTAMGQNWLRPNGPDGWPEASEAWITAHGLAARLQWAMWVPQHFFHDLPDPRQFLEDSLAGQVDAKLRFAVANAESRQDGIGLILASPAFQRR